VDESQETPTHCFESAAASSGAIRCLRKAEGIAHHDAKITPPFHLTIATAMTTAFRRHRRVGSVPASF